jgi:hypothetical protein
MKNASLLIIVLLFFNQIGNSQISSKFDFFLGYGFYEGINAGAEFYFKSYTQSVSLSIGANNLFDKKQKYFALIPEYNIAIFRHRRNPDDLFKWHVNNKFVFWQLDDEYYKWRVISFIPSLNRQFSLFKKLSISIDAGPSFNLVIYNKRKTFKEVGWPYHVLPNIRVKFIF